MFLTGSFLLEDQIIWKLGLTLRCRNVFYVLLGFIRYLHYLSAYLSPNQPNRSPQTSLPPCIFYLNEWTFTQGGDFGIKFTVRSFSCYLSMPCQIPSFMNVLFQICFKCMSTFPLPLSLSVKFK